jgi:thiol-disulfide isomerase/thioredoxin
MNDRLCQSGRRAAGAALVALLVSGCAKFDPVASEEPEALAPAADAGGSEASATKAGSAESAADASTIDLKAVDRASYDATLADLRGKVVLVDFWATWCGPCLEQLPHSTALAEERRDDGLVVVTVSMDDPEEVDRIKSTLASRGGQATVNLVSADGGGSRSMSAFDVTGGALPHYKLYDRIGELKQTFGTDPSAEVQFTADDIASAVDVLLNNQD